MLERAALALEAHQAQEELGPETELGEDLVAGETWSSGSEGGGEASPESPQGEYRDDVAGHVLPPGLTQEARMEELKFLEEWHVWVALGQADASRPPELPAVNPC